MKNVVSMVAGLLTIVAVLSGCKKDPASPENTFVADTLIHQGVYIINEGNYGDPTSARLTVYDYEKSTVQIDAFEAANNGVHAGSVGDDIQLNGNKLYLLMSGSNDLRVLNLPQNTQAFARSFAGDHDSTMHDLLVDPVHQYAYVTRLYNSKVTILSLDSLRFIKSITVGTNPQGMLQVGDKLFVANSGYYADSTVSVIDIPSLTVVRTIVTLRGPTSIALTSAGEVAVACTGDGVSNGAVAILKADGSGIPRVISCPEPLLGGIAADKAGNVYVNSSPAGSYSGGPIMKVVASTGVVTENFFSGNWYAIAFNKYTNELFVSDILNFSGNPAKIRVVGLDGSLHRAFNAQIGADAFAFYWR